MLRIVKVRFLFVDSVDAPPFGAMDGERP